MKKDSKLYGIHIIETVDGSWYWSPQLQDVSYVPKGKKIAYARFALEYRHNNYNDAIRRACIKENEIRMGKYELKPTHNLHFSEPIE